MERESYYVRRAQAEMKPKEIISLILDGMDQSKTDLPHYYKWNNPNVRKLILQKNVFVNRAILVFFSYFNNS